LKAFTAEEFHSDELKSEGLHEQLGTWEPSQHLLEEKKSKPMWPMAGPSA
jgi:hypothetical protein